MSVYSLIARPAMSLYGTTVGYGTASAGASYGTERYRSHPTVGITTSTHSRYTGIDRVLPEGPAGVVREYLGNYRRKKKLSKSNRMPKGKRRTRRPRRRLRRYRRKRSIIPYQVVPRTRLVKMRLCERLSLTGTTGAIGNANIYYNSLQDPLITNGTAQPYYYDQIKTMYRTAIVVGAKASVTFHNTSSTVPVVVGLYLIPWDNSTSINSYEFFREINAKGRQRILSSDIDTCHMSLKISTRKHLGLRNLKDNDDIRCDIENDGDPTKLGAFTILTQALDQTATSTTEAILVLEQVVLLMDPYQPARSTDV